MVEGRIAWKHGFSNNEFTEDTADRPHIDGLRILSGPEQNLRSPIPSGGHILCKIDFRSLFGFVDRPGQAEVSYLNFALRVNQNIAGF